MSNENVEALRRGLEAFNRRDKIAWLELCAPDLENVPPREWPESDPIRGREAVWDFFIEGNEPWEQSPFEFSEVVDGGSKVVADVRQEARGKESGATVAWRYWQVATFRAGKVLRFEWFADRAEALAAAGLAE
jgi:ketosteroid isomerase-like protein